jgi:hypothetical protein
MTPASEKALIMECQYDTLARKNFRPGLNVEESRNTVQVDYICLYKKGMFNHVAVASSVNGKLQVDWSLWKVRQDFMSPFASAFPRRLGVRIFFSAQRMNV